MPTWDERPANSNALHKRRQQPPKVRCVVARKSIHCANEFLPVVARERPKCRPSITTAKNVTAFDGLEARFDFIENLVDECMKLIFVSQSLFHQVLQNVTFLRCGSIRIDIEVCRGDHKFNL